MKQAVSFLLLVCVGCATLIAVTPNLKGVNTVVILPFRNSVILYKELGWKSFERIQTELSKRSVPFKYLDRPALGPIVAETWLGGDKVITKKDAMRFGKTLFTDAVVVGEIISCVVSDPVEKPDRYDRELQKWHYAVKKTAELKYKAIMYSSATGKILWAYSGKAEANAISEFYKGSSYNIESNETLVDRMTQSLAEDIAKRLTKS